MMTPEDRERLRANAQAAMDRVDAMNGKGGSPEYSSDERPFPDEILELLDERDMWRKAREHALDEVENADRRGDAILEDLHATRARHARAEKRLWLALEILDGNFHPADRIGDLHGAMTRALKGEL